MRTAMELFVAIKLSRNIREWLQEKEEKLESTLNDEFLTKNCPDDFHITLLYLGIRDDIDEIDNVLRHIKKTPFTVQIKGTGVFDNFNEHVIWAGVEDSSDKSLQTLQKRISYGLSSLGGVQNNNSFIPHITLLYTKDGYRLQEYSRNIFIEPVFFEVKEFQLYSILKETEKYNYHFKILKTYPLAFQEEVSHERNSNSLC